MAQSTSNLVNNGSVVDYLNSQGKASDYNSRAGLASQYGISNYTGSADQNTQLLGLLQAPKTGSTAPAGIFSSNLLPQTQTTQPGSGIAYLEQIHNSAPGSGLNYLGNQNNSNLVNPGVPYQAPAQTSYQPPAGGGTIGYTKSANETIDQYNARIAAARAAQGSGGQGSGGSNGLQTLPQTPQAPLPGLVPTTPQPYTVNPDLYGQLITGLANRSQQAGQDYQNQIAEANKYNEALKTSRMNEAKGLAENAQNPIPLEFQQGRGQVLQSQYAQEQAALGAGYSGAANLAGQANTQQGLQQSALATAAGLAAPQPANPLGTFNPATGQYSQYGGGSGSGIAGAGAVLGNLSAAQNYQQNLLPSFNQAQSVYGGLTNFIAQNPDINPTSVNFVNSINAWARGEQLSDPKYKQFTQYLNELLQTLTPIIGSAGVSDYKSQLVQSMVNPTANSQSILAQVQNLMNIAKGKMEATQQTFSGGNMEGQNYTNPNKGQTMFGSFF